MSTGGRWTTYQGDPARSGVAAGPSLADVRHAWTSAKLDGTIYPEPLAIGARVITATENDTVYALDAATGAVVWSRHVGMPVDSATLPCGNIVPTSGITATPVVDPATGVLYVAAFLSPARHELFALRHEAEWPAVPPPAEDAVDRWLDAYERLYRAAVGAPAPAVEASA